MEIIKEYTRADKNYYVSIRSNTYSNTVEFFETLFAIAHNDFGVSASEVFVVLHSGIRYKHTFGIRFSIPVDIAPKMTDYTYVERLEDIM